MYVYLEKSHKNLCLFEYQCNNQSSLKVQHKKLQTTVTIVTTYKGAMKTTMALPSVEFYYLYINRHCLH